ncbi:Hypp3564 [Branchiostoma lanceolatum]|uniref:Hypp3564 protein n=1 Tax=Branchiostoma lanceolatum TaxID=7740 RepID=A0A8K0EXF2_BRALA|nr:Hypp3564 [Branchiostoma lanceolatum]
MPKITLGSQLPLGRALFIDLSQNLITYMSSCFLERVRGSYLQLDRNPFECDEGWEWFSRHMSNSSRILCFESMFCGPLQDWSIWVPFEECSGETTIPPTATSVKIERSTANGTTTTSNHTTKRDEKVDVFGVHVSEVVKEAAIILGVLELLLAFCCAVIKVRVSRRAAMVPAANPAADTANPPPDTVHYENGDEEEEQDHQYEDCSYDRSHHVHRTQLTATFIANVKFTENNHYVEDSNRSQTSSAIAHGVLSPRSKDDTHNINSALKPAEDVADSLDTESHFYENDKDLQEAEDMVAHEEDVQNHVYDNWKCDGDDDPTGHHNSQETSYDKESEVLDCDAACQGGPQNGGLQDEPADHERNPTVPEANEFAHESGGSMDGSNDHQRAEGHSTNPQWMTDSMTADECIADEIGGENVCTYIVTKGNDTYEAAGTDDSREEPGGAYGTETALSAHPTRFAPSKTINNVDIFYGAT